MFEIKKVDILSFIDKTNFLFQGNVILNLNFNDRKFKNPLDFLEKKSIGFLEFTLENKKLSYHTKTFHETRNFCEIKNNLEKKTFPITENEENYKKKKLKKKERLVSLMVGQTDFLNKRKFLNIYFSQKLRSKLIKIFNFELYDTFELDFPFIFSTVTFLNQKKDNVFDIKTLTISNFLSYSNNFLISDLKIFKKLNLIKNTFKIEYIFKKLKIRFFFLQGLFIRKRKFSILLICNAESIKKKLKPVVEMIKFFNFLIFFFNKPKNVIVIATIIKKKKNSENKNKVKMLSDIKQKKNKKIFGIFIFGLKFIKKKDEKWFVDFFIDNFLLFYKKMSSHLEKKQDFADNLFIFKKKICFSKNKNKKIFFKRFLSFVEIYQIMRFLTVNEIHNLSNFFRGLFFKKKNFFFLKQTLYSFIFRKISNVEIVIKNEKKKNKIEIAIHSKKNMIGEFFPIFFFNIENKKKISLIEIYSSWQIFEINWDPKKTFLNKQPLLLFPDIYYMKNTNILSIFYKNPEWKKIWSYNLSEENSLILIFLKNIKSKKKKKRGPSIEKFSFLKVKIILMFFKILQTKPCFREKKRICKFLRNIILSKIRSSTMIFVYLTIIDFILKEKDNFLKTGENFLKHAFNQNIFLKLCRRDKYVLINCFFYSKFLF